jgi:type VI secretion system secreted protein Hcp
MAVDMFIKIGDLKGESKDSKHKDEIDVLAWSWGFAQTGASHGGGGGGAGKVNVHDLNFTKPIDASSNMLISSVCRGTHHKEATLFVRKAGHDQLEYIIVKLKDVIVTSVSMGGSRGEEQLTESVSLNFGEFEYAYQPQKADGSAEGGKKEYKYSVRENITK